MDDSVLHPPVPQYFLMDITAHCNLRCPFCPTGNGAIAMAERGLMSDAAFDIIWSKIRATAEVIDLFNWGEPLMHKGLWRFVRTIAANGTRAQISTNLSVRLFDRSELEEIVASGLHCLHASIDGVSQAAYGAYRVNGDVAKALVNLRNLKKVRDRMGSATPHLIWAFYVNRHNEHEVDLARELAAGWGIPIWFKELSCPPDFQTTLLHDRPEIFLPDPGVAESWMPRVNRGLGQFVLDPRLPQTCNVCRMPFEVLTINFNGDVYPCSAVTGRHMVVGNLLRDSLEEIWVDRMARNRRQLIDTGSPIEASQCRSCEHFPRAAAGPA